MLLLVRHGETDANRRGLYLGRADLDLTDRGHRQAAAMASALPAPDVVVSSPLRRARQTADVFGSPVEIDQRWIELDYGELDLHPVGHLPPEIDARWRTDPDVAPPGGEPLSALWGRVHAACEQLVDRAESSVVIVVTHVGPIKAAIGWALGTPPSVAADRLFVEDAGVSRIDVVDGERIVRWFNRLGHQPGEGSEEPSGGLAPGR
jgi:broad specificity phosphatase PhoE